MTAPELTVERMSATVRLPPDRPDPAAVRNRCERIFDDLRHGRLASAVQRIDVGDGHWCIRRLDVPLLLDPDCTDIALSERWAAMLASALVDAVSTESSDVLHYSRQADVLQDVVVSLALGNVEHDWAWKQAMPALPVEPSDPRRTVLRAFGQHRRDALPALLGAIDGCGLAPIDRLLQADGWTELAEVVAKAHDAQLRPSAPVPRRTTVQRETAESLVARSRLARRIVRGRIRPDSARLRSWAFLVLADIEPAALQSRSNDGLLAEVGECLRVILIGPSEESRPFSAGPKTRRPSDPDAIDPRAPATSATQTPLPTDGETRHRPDRGERGDASPKLVGHHADDGAIAGPPDDVIEVDDATSSRTPGRATAWAGLLFLLCSADDADIPGVILEDDALRAQSFSWVLHQLAIRLCPVDGNDAAALAFAGLDDERAAALAKLVPVPQRIADRLDTIAAHWTRVTIDRLTSARQSSWHAEIADHGHPGFVLDTVTRRRGIIVASPGWIDVSLDLAEVDIDVRRAGLDLDPGWIPWLGTVVRFRYE